MDERVPGSEVEQHEKKCLLDGMRRDEMGYIHHDTIKRLPGDKSSSSLCRSASPLLEATTQTKARIRRQLPLLIVNIAVAATIAFKTIQKKISVIAQKTASAAEVIAVECRGSGGRDPEDEK